MKYYGIQVISSFNFGYHGSKKINLHDKMTIDKTIFPPTIQIRVNVALHTSNNLYAYIMKQSNCMDD